jgi:hypothetical protein
MTLSTDTMNEDNSVGEAVFLDRGMLLEIRDMGYGMKPRETEPFTRRDAGEV